MGYIKCYNETVGRAQFFSITSVKFKKNGNTTTCIVTAKKDPKAWEVCDLIEKETSHKFIGTAICSSKDSFDEIKGRDIAEHRAMRQYYTFLRTFFLKLHDYFAQASTEAFNFANWANNKAVTQKELIDNLK